MLLLTFTRSVVSIQPWFWKIQLHLNLATQRLAVFFCEGQIINILCLSSHMCHILLSLVTFFFSLLFKICKNHLCGSGAHKNWSRWVCAVCSLPASVPTYFLTHLPLNLIFWASSKSHSLNRTLSSFQHWLELWFGGCTDFHGINRNA